VGGARKTAEASRVELQDFCAHPEVIMPTANSSASKEVVTAALLVIGGKILSGRTKDQNIGYIAEYLPALGIDLKEVRVVGDEETAIVDALNALRHRSIGPTHGDITADCVAKAFGVPIDSDPRALAILHKWVETTGAEMNEARLRLTRIPKGADLILNKVSGGTWLLDRQCNRDGGCAIDHAGDAR
jgi:molybdopterin-biosynthesis enzyme MoeA-like protein